MVFLNPLLEFNIGTMTKFFEESFVRSPWFHVSNSYLICPNTDCILRRAQSRSMVRDDLRCYGFDDPAPLLSSPPWWYWRNSFIRSRSISNWPRRTARINRDPGTTMEYFSRPGGINQPSSSKCCISGWFSGVSTILNAKCAPKSGSSASYILSMWDMISKVRIVCVIHWPSMSGAPGRLHPTAAGAQCRHRPPPSLVSLMLCTLFLL